MSDLYSNCVILEFTAPITRVQLDRIGHVIHANWADIDAPPYVSLPPLKTVVCAEREGNSVVPSIAADEC